MSLELQSLQQGRPPWSMNSPDALSVFFRELSASALRIEAQKSDGDRLEVAVLMLAMADLEFGINDPGGLHRRARGG
jgi:hypothetical protein